MGAVGFNGRARTFQPDQARAMEDCKDRLGAPSGDFKEFTPLDIFGLLDWHRADMGITLVGSKVSAWADQSGNGKHLTQNTDARRFDYITSGGLNGQPLLRPTLGGDDRFMNWTPWAGPSVGTVFLVTNFKTAANYQSGLFINGGAGVNFSGAYLGGSGGNLNRPCVFTSADTASWTSTLVDNTPYLIKWAWNDTNENCWTQVNSETEVNAVSGVAFTVGDMKTLGMDPAITGTQDIISDVYELIVYNRRLSPEEEALLRRYIKIRYGIVL